MARVRSVTGTTEHELSAFELCWVEPGRASVPAELDALGGEWSAAPVPGTAASALRAQGRFSFDRVPSFDALDVWYRTGFAGDGHAAHERGWLCFDGLATLAEAWVKRGKVPDSPSLFLAPRPPAPA